MANAVAHKTLGAVFSNELRVEKLTYNFAGDGGATGTIDLATFARKCLVTRAYAHVETACTSGGSATVAVGINDTDIDAYVTASTGAVANLVDDAVLYVATTAANVAQVDDTIRVTIATQPLTAGKVNVYVEYMNVV